MREYYQKPLASIHDDGFVKYAESAAEMVVRSLADRGIDAGHVIDLGCGTGRFAEVVSNAGHQVTGLDISAGMIELAKKRLPHVRFVHGSYRDYQFPLCDCVAAVGEIFNYRFDDQLDGEDTGQVFQRIYNALRPPGIFLFDMATRGRLGGQATRLQHFETPDWSIVVDSEEQDYQLRRRCLMFYRDGDNWQRHEETHWLNLVDQTRIVEQLQTIGFSADLTNDYADVPLPPGMFRVLAKKI